MEQRGTWTLRPGQALLVPAGQPHRTLESERHEAWTLTFSAPSCAARQLLEPFERVRDGGAPVVQLAPGREAWLEALLRELERVTSASADEVEQNLLALLLAEVERAERRCDETAPRASVAGQALRYIERHCLGRLTLADVAVAIGRSSTYVTTALRRATGLSANQWIVSGRMAEARRLLLSSDERIDAIAARVGYADPTHFIRMFRREYGVTPAAWRRAATG